MNTSENKNPHRIDPMYADVIDAPSTREILSREVQYSGYVLQAAVEHYDLDGQGTTLTRDVIDMPGSVAVAALNNWNEILLLRQYRHPVRMNLWEVPAGLLDITGEDPLYAAQRELAEETDLGAHRWRSLVDYYTTPGAASEAGRIYLAQDLYEIPEADRIVRRDEEAEITYRWVPLE
ncbi:MAG: NUDIX domain-containing protein, partial [Rothia dentocariosa]